MGRAKIKCVGKGLVKYNLLCIGMDLEAFMTCQKFMKYADFFFFSETSAKNCEIGSFSKFLLSWLERLNTVKTAECCEGRIAEVVNWWQRSSIIRHEFSAHHFSVEDSFGGSAEAETQRLHD